MPAAATWVMAFASSAGNTRGLIEAVDQPSGVPSCWASSAGNTRGLIEAADVELRRHPAERLPRGIPAASLKRVDCRLIIADEPSSSAGNTRGLIEALRYRHGFRR